MSIVKIDMGRGIFKAGKGRRKIAFYEIDNGVAIHHYDGCTDLSVEEIGSLGRKLLDVYAEKISSKTIK